jgi:hypothetical protein
VFTFSLSMTDTENDLCMRLAQSCLRFLVPFESFNVERKEYSDDLDESLLPLRELSYVLSDASGD